jgi:hypothetical protein
MQNMAKMMMMTFMKIGMVLQCINGVGSNPVEGRTKI